MKPEDAIISEQDKAFMQKAIELSIQNVDNGGGPFGAVIVKDGKIIATEGGQGTGQCPIPCPPSSRKSDFPLCRKRSCLLPLYDESLCQNPQRKAPFRIIEEQFFTFFAIICISFYNFVLNQSTLNTRNDTWAAGCFRSDKTGNG